jgi:hypothetical protein
MASAETADIRALRERLTPPQRELIDLIWRHYRDRNEWMAARALHQQLGKGAVQAACDALGASVLRAQGDDEAIGLTFFGVLLAADGAHGERLLVRYLEYVRDRYRADATLEWVGSDEVEAALALSAEDSRLLRQLIRLSHWWGGGSAFGHREWAVGVPIDVDDLVAEADLTPYVRAHVLADVSRETRAGAAEAPLGEFAFVPDARLRDRLAADWHEAQDVCQVMGWKSCIILCGGILETLLTQPWTGAAKPAARQAVDRLVALAEERALLRPGSVQIGPALRAYKTFLSPERSARFTLTRADAEAALAAVRSCLKQLGKN